MKTTLRIAFSLSFLTLFVLAGFGQDKSYGNVYYSVKNGDTWGGLTKMASAKATLEKYDKGEAPIVLTLNDGKGNNYFFASSFEAKTADGKAFHKVIGGGIAYPDPKWTAPSGNTEISWVYFNKNIYEIFMGDPKPFDVELQFADGSAIKYFISPSY